MTAGVRTVFPQPESYVARDISISRRCRNLGGKAAREQMLGGVSTDIYILLYVFSFLLLW
jgi:hypothetical protein